MTDESLDFANLVRLLRQMAHDMRGPLGVLSITADMFVQGGYGELNPKQERAAKRMQRASNRILALLDDFMAYVKAEAQQLPLEIAPFNPQALLANLRETVLSEAQAKNLAVRLVDGESLPPILCGDAALIRRVVLALLWNAINFSDQGQITVRSGWVAASCTWAIEICDEGRGIAQESAPHIFEPFWQGVERPSSPTSGFGMGLAMAQALTRVMGGQLALETTGPKGSAFCVRLPLRTDLAETLKASQTAGDPSSTPHAASIP
jgi:two-component system capsular synthesis sensor histidine kinase RcsC